MDEFDGGDDVVVSPPPDSSANAAQFDGGTDGGNAPLAQPPRPRHRRPRVSSGKGPPVLFILVASATGLWQDFPGIWPVAPYDDGARRVIGVALGHWQLLSPADADAVAAAAWLTDGAKRFLRGGTLVGYVVSGYTSRRAGCCLRKHMRDAALAAHRFCFRQQKRGTAPAVVRFCLRRTKHGARRVPVLFAQAQWRHGARCVSNLFTQTEARHGVRRATILSAQTEAMHGSRYVSTLLLRRQKRGASRAVLRFSLLNMYNVAVVS